jgi:hypothetical protein
MKTTIRSVNMDSTFLPLKNLGITYNSSELTKL